MNSHPTTHSKITLEQWFIVAAVMLSTIMEILDTTIVNVSLPHMMGSLSADQNEISWVLTSYIVAAGILMPLTGFLVNRIGCRRLLLINILGFMIASGLCGVATNLAQIVFFRLLQGVFGASLVPLSQYILRSTFSREEQPKMMAIWGIGVMAAPVMGPTIGGYITEALNWRWIFYINVPVCMVNFFLVLAFIKETPIKKESIDWLGLILMVAFIGSLQLVLDRGQIEDWFASNTIRWLSFIFVFTFPLFIYRCFAVDKPIINLRLFSDRNFAACTAIIVFFAAAVFGSLTLLPQMLEILFHYSAHIAGISMAPRGIASAIMMAISSQLMMRGISANYFIFFGLAVCSITLWEMSRITLDTGFDFIVIIGFIQGLGIGAFFVPLSTVIYSTLPRESVAEAAGLFSFGRNIGNAIGISMLTTFLDRNSQKNWNLIASHLYSANPNLVKWLQHHHFSLQSSKTIGILGNILHTQANFIGYMNAFGLGAIILIATLFLTFIIKSGSYKPDLNEAVH